VACHFAAVLHQLNGEALPALERAKEVVTLADEYGLELWLAFGNIDLGWAEFELGNQAGGLEKMRQGLAAYEATGARLWRPHFLGLLANSLAKASQTEEALETATQAIALSESTGEKFPAAELHRLMGVMMLKAGGRKSAVEAEEHFAKGLAIAHQQGAKAWESRIHHSMELMEPTA
jgi:predicted ATPase